MKAIILKCFLALLVQYSHLALALAEREPVIIDYEKSCADGNGQWDSVTSKCQCAGQYQINSVKGERCPMLTQCGGTNSSLGNSWGVIVNNTLFSWDTIVDNCAVASMLYGIPMTCPNENFLTVEVLNSYGPNYGCTPIGGGQYASNEFCSINYAYTTWTRDCVPETIVCDQPLGPPPLIAECETDEDCLGRPCVDWVCS